MMSITFENRDFRHHMRVNIPGRVVIDDNPVQYWINDISEGGLEIAGWVNYLKLDQKCNAIIRISFESYDLKLKGSVIVRRLDTEAGMAGLQFLDDDESRTDMIRLITADRLKGDLSETNEILRRSAAESDEDPAPEVPAKPMRATLVRQGILIALGLGIFYVVLASLYVSLFTVSSEYAAVSAPVTRLSAPASGNIVEITAEFGQRVKPGAALFQIEDTSLAHMLASARADYRLAVAERFSAERQLGGSGKILASYLLQLEDTETSLAAQVDALQAKLAAGERNVDRLRQLEQGQFASGAQLDQRIEDIADIRVELADKQARLFAVRESIQLAKAGLRPAAVNIEDDFPPYLEAALGVARSREDGAREVLDALDLQARQQSVQSPCDCIVGDVFYRVGESVARAQPIMELYSVATEYTEIEALVPQNRIALLHTGDHVEVLLAGRDDPVYGTVTDISRYKAANTRKGVPVELYRALDGGVVHVRLLENVSARPGTPAQISVKASLSSVAMWLFGTATVL